MIKPALYPWSEDEIVQRMLSLAPDVCEQLQIEIESKTGKPIIRNELTSALINITAHLIRLTTERLNEIPNKAFLQILSYANQQLLLPSPAMMPVRFNIRENYTYNNEIPERFQVATLPDKNGDINVFETVDKINAHILSVEKAWYIDYYRDRFTDLSGHIDNNSASPIMMFNGYQKASYSIYVTHPIFESFSKETDNDLLMRMTFRNPYNIYDISDPEFAVPPGNDSREDRDLFFNSNDEERSFDIGIYYYTEDSKRYDIPKLKIYTFDHISSSASPYDRYAVYFYTGKIENKIKTTSINIYSKEKEKFVEKIGKFLIFEIKPRNPQQFHRRKTPVPHLETIEFRFNRIPHILEGWDLSKNPIPWIYKDTINLDYAFFNSQPIDLTKTFKPFGDEPAFNDTFYFASQFFSRRGHACHIYTWLLGQMSESKEFSEENEKSHAPDVTCPVKLSWEYYDGNEWKVLFYSSCNTGDQAIEIVTGNDGDYIDSSYAFHYSSRPYEEIKEDEDNKTQGPIRITLPENIQQVSVNGIYHWWLRVRIVKGGYEKKYESDNNNSDNNNIELNRPTEYVPPMFKTFTIDFCGNDKKVPTFSFFDDFLKHSIIQKTIETTEPEWNNTTDSNFVIQRLIDGGDYFIFDPFYHPDIVNNFIAFEQEDAPIQGGILCCPNPEKREYIIGTDGMTGDFTIDTGFQIFNYTGGICFRYTSSECARVLVTNDRSILFQIVYQNYIVYSKIIVSDLKYSSYYAVRVSRDDNTFIVIGSQSRNPDWTKSTINRMDLDRLRIDFPKGAFKYTCFVDGLTDSISPVADAGSNRIIYDIEQKGVCTVPLSAQSSYSAPGANITKYSWTLNDIVISNFQNCLCTLPIGIHRIKLKVIDSNNNEAYDTAVIQIKSLSDPIADAGSDLQIMLRNGDFTQISFDGTRSYSPNGSINKWEWILNGTTVGDWKTIKRRVGIGLHTMQLKVTDNYNRSAFSNISIAVQKEDYPFANAGVAQIVRSESNVEKTITLDGSESSSPEGTLIISWEWMENGISIAHGEKADVKLSVGIHIIQLIVKNSKNNVAKDTVIVIIDPGVSGKVKQALYFQGKNAETSFDSPVCINGNIYTESIVNFNGKKHQSLINGSLVTGVSNKWGETSQKVTVEGIVFIGTGLRINYGSLNCLSESGFEKDIQITGGDSLFLQEEGYFNNRITENRVSNSTYVYHSGKMNSSMVTNADRLFSEGKEIDIPSKLNLGSKYSSCDIEVNEDKLLEKSLSLSALISQRQLRSSLNCGDIERLYDECSSKNRIWNDFLILHIDADASFEESNKICHKKVIFIVSSILNINSKMYTSSNVSNTMIYVREGGEIINMGGKGLFRGYINVKGKANYKWEENGWVSGAIHHTGAQSTSFVSIPKDQVRSGVISVSVEQKVFDELSKIDENGDQIIIFTK